MERKKTLNQTLFEIYENANIEFNYQSMINLGDEVGVEWEDPGFLVTLS